MTTTIRFIGRCTALLLMIASASAAAHAQTRDQAGVAQAVALENKVNAWLDVPEKWSHLARTLEQAAQIRGSDDPQAISDLMFSANVRLRVGDRDRAQKQFVQAAEWALANGDVERAAQGFTRATALAVDMRQMVYAHELRDRVLRLARSPLLTVSQRDAILRPFVHS